MDSRPFFADSSYRHDFTNVLFFGQAHGLASLGILQRNTCLRKDSLQRAHGSQAPEINGGTCPVQNDRSQLAAILFGPRILIGHCRSSLRTPVSSQNDSVRLRLIYAKSSLESYPPSISWFI